ncbi:MAG: lipoprotein signal peptidase [Bacteroidia bacterium]|nr:lipoprotein signal peptidase [Bacteroidia bacterium]
MKPIHSILIISIIVVSDQVLKLWVKTNMYLGEYFSVLGDWFYIHFTENNGMAFGMEFAGDYGKFTLSILRICAIVGIGVVLFYLFKRKASSGLIISGSLIFAGALGNIIDSVFYGVLFDYNNLLFGRVVDMFYFPLIEGLFPNWFPFWGGEEFVFFRPVFNIADTAISVGVGIILVFQRDFFKKESTETNSVKETTETV